MVDDWLHRCLRATPADFRPGGCRIDCLTCAGRRIVRRWTDFFPARACSPHCALVPGLAGVAGGAANRQQRPTAISRSAAPRWTKSRTSSTPRAACQEHRPATSRRHPDGVQRLGSAMPRAGILQRSSRPGVTVKAKVILPRWQPRGTEPTATPADLGHAVVRHQAARGKSCRHCQKQRPSWRRLKAIGAANCARWRPEKAQADSSGAASTTAIRPSSTASKQ